MTDETLPGIEGDDLTDKQVIFVEECLVCWNATEAARRAGYSGNDVTLAVVGWENLRKPKIQERVRARMTEKAMAADEVLARLADHARGNMVDFLSWSGRGARLDLAKAAKAGKLHLVKSFTKGRRGTSIELYDAQAALVHIAKHLGLFVDQVKLSGSVVVEKRTDLSGLSNDDLEQLENILARAAGNTNAG
jgi:phage terminase small subunit